MAMRAVTSCLSLAILSCQWKSMRPGVCGCKRSPASGKKSGFRDGVKIQQLRSVCSAVMAYGVC